MPTYHYPMALPLLAPLPAGPWNLIYADPCWWYNSRPMTGTRFGGSADEHYLDDDGDGKATMTHDELCNIPVSQVVAPDAYLVMWATWPTIYLPDGRHKLISWEDIQRFRAEPMTAERYALLLDIVEKYMRAQTAFDVARAWGFDHYCTLGLLWVKTNDHDGRPRFGQGFYMAANSEPALLFVRGRPWANVHPFGKKISQVLAAPQKHVPDEIWCPLTEHSEKPDKARVILREYFGDIPALELFSRHPQGHRGFTMWGNEVGKIVPNDCPCCAHLRGAAPVPAGATADKFDKRQLSFM
jgi:N6-adenosine-specific RNA methylase IME4